MNLLSRHGKRRPSALERGSMSYEWRRDFPIQLQARKGAKQTILKVEFLLDDNEIQDFRSEIGSNLNGSLPLEIKIGKDENPEIRCIKSGKGTVTLNSRSSAIANFVAERIHFNYVPAIRTESSTLELIRNMLSQELRILERDDNYLRALETIAELQRPVLEQLSRRVQGPLKEFLPSIKNVKIEISDSSRRYGVRSEVSVIVDDGTPTSIEHKGDGVKSLAALGLLKSQNSRSGASLLAIEEPESHLHPAAIHQVSEIILSISATSQVIITTHNPLFVDRANIRSNIIVAGGSATPARSIAQIRDILGVKASDNLTNANYALVVEGEEDVIALKAMLPNLSEKIGKALRSNAMVIEPIGGAGNLTYKLSLLRTSLCAVHCLLDHDDAGRLAYAKACAENLLTAASCTFVTCPGMPDSEFEDCIDVAVYKDEFREALGVDLNSTKFRGSRKWSDRLKSTLIDQGKLASESEISKAKYTLANIISKRPKDVLQPNKRNSIDALIPALERFLKI